MKNYLLLLFIIFIFGCSDSENDTQVILNQTSKIEKPKENLNIKAPPEKKKLPVLTEDEWQLKYNVYISEDFSSKDKDAIKQAVFAWKNATNNVVDFEISTSEVEKDCNYCINFVSNTSKTVHNIGDYETVAITLYNSSRASSTIHIAMDYVKSNLPFDKKLLYRISAHELGHSMYLDHGDDGTIMAPRTNTASDNITCKDLQKLFKIQKLHGEINKKICHKK